MPRPDTGTRSPEAAAPAGARATIDAIPARPGDDDVPARFPHRRLRPRTRPGDRRREPSPGRPRRADRVGKLRPHAGDGGPGPPTYQQIPRKQTGTATPRPPERK